MSQDFLLQIFFIFSQAQEQNRNFYKNLRRYSKVKFATGINDTSGKFATSSAGVVDTGGKFATGVSDTAGKQREQY